MLCKNLRSAAKNSHTGLFFHPAGAALVRIPLINKTTKTLRIDFIYPKGFGGTVACQIELLISKQHCFAVVKKKLR